MIRTKDLYLEIIENKIINDKEYAERLIQYNISNQLYGETDIHTRRRKDTTSKHRSRKSLSWRYNK